MRLILASSGGKVERGLDWRKKAANRVNSFSFISFAYWTLFRMKRIVAPFFRRKTNEKTNFFCQWNVDL